MRKTILLATTAMLALAIGSFDTNAQSAYGASIGGTPEPGTGVAGKVDTLSNKFSGKSMAITPYGTPEKVETTTGGDKSNQSTTVSTDVVANGKSTIAGTKNNYVAAPATDLDSNTTGSTVRRDGVSTQVPLLDSRTSGTLVFKPNGRSGLESGIAGAPGAGGALSDFAYTGVTGAVAQPDSGGGNCGYAPSYDVAHKFLGMVWVCQ